MVCNALRKQSIIDIMEVIKMKKSDLHREWARVLDMCEGTKVDPRTCWKYNGKFIGFEPEFTDFPDRYEFMVAILEDKPVFVGDKVYANNCTLALTVDGISKQKGYVFVGNCTNYDISILSWNPPKKTFLLEVNESHLQALSKVTFADVYILNLAEMAKKILTENIK